MVKLSAQLIPWDTSSHVNHSSRCRLLLNSFLAVKRRIDSDEPDLPVNMNPRVEIWNKETSKALDVTLLIHTTREGSLAPKLPGNSEMV